MAKDGNNGSNYEGGKDILEMLLQRKATLEQEMADLQRRIEEHDANRHRFAICRSEATDVFRCLDTWESSSSLPFMDNPLSVLFLGPLSGEWAAQSRYRGELPGFGGFLITVRGVRILIDPGATTLKNLYAAGIHARELDAVIATHGHWDCLRDLTRVVMAACPSEDDVEFARRRSSRLHLYAPASVLYGTPMNREALMRVLQRTEGDTDELHELLQPFQVMNGPGVNSYDVFKRLRRRYTELEQCRRYELRAGLELYTRQSVHSEMSAHHDGDETIASLDFVVRDGERAIARCTYTSDSEYRPNLADQYADDPSLGPIDLLICNVKTLDLRTYTSGPNAGYTQRHLGWRGLLQLTRDMRERGLLTDRSLVVLRAFGIETVARVDHNDGVLLATPDKLRVYEEQFRKESGQAGLVPGITWVGVAGDHAASPEIHHHTPPFLPQGTYQRFGNVFYRSRSMSEVVAEARAIAEDPTLSCILITGETGTGKDEIAKAIHFAVQRKGRLVIDNAHGRPPDILRNALYGCRRNSYSGIPEGIVGLLTQAADGTLNLQEVGEMHIEAQTFLLTLLEEGHYTPHGETQARHLNARIIMTTEVDLQRAMTEGTFRPALYHRLRRIHIPPLRERPEDIAALVHGWHTEDPERYPLLGDEAIDLLQSYAWPGNVRSLKHVMEQLRRCRDTSLEAVRREAERVQTTAEEETPQNLPVHGESGSRSPLDPKAAAILRAMPAGEAFSRRELEERTGMKQGVVNRCLNQLLDARLIVRLSDGPNTRYQRREHESDTRPEVP